VSLVIVSSGSSRLWLNSILTTSPFLRLQPEATVYTFCLHRLRKYNGDEVAAGIVRSRHVWEIDLFAHPSAKQWGAQNVLIYSFIQERHEVPIDMKLAVSAV
jgi:hypothetical protein